MECTPFLVPLLPKRCQYISTLTRDVGTFIGAIFEELDRFEGNIVYLHDGLYIFEDIMGILLGTLGKYVVYELNERGVFGGELVAFYQGDICGGWFVR